MSEPVATCRWSPWIRRLRAELSHCKMGIRRLRHDPLILLGYDGSPDARCAIDRAGELLHGQLARAGIGIGIGTLDFEAIHAARERAGSCRLGALGALASSRRIGAGISAAPAITRQKESMRPVIWSAPLPIESWKKRMPPPIAIRLAATEVNAITSSGGPSCRLRADA